MLVRSSICLLGSESVYSLAFLSYGACGGGGRGLAFMGVYRNVCVCVCVQGA